LQKNKAITGFQGFVVSNVRLLGSLQSPVTNFARVMNQLAEKGGASACGTAAAE
jgi:hypothetical protein